MSRDCSLLPQLGETRGGPASRLLPPFPVAVCRLTQIVDVRKQPFPLTTQSLYHCDLSRPLLLKDGEAIPQLFLQLLLPLVTLPGIISPEVVRGRADASELLAQSRRFGQGRNGVFEGSAQLSNLLDALR